MIFRTGSSFLGSADTGPRKNSVEDLRLPPAWVGEASHDPARPAQPPTKLANLHPWKQCLQPRTKLANLHPWKQCLTPPPFLLFGAFEKPEYFSRSTCLPFSRRRNLDFFFFSPRNSPQPGRDSPRGKRNKFISLRKLGFCLSSLPLPLEKPIRSHFCFPLKIKFS